ncbi:MAG: carboxypeptidase regulatory-like domain-containing protein, partial [Gemmatimonadales bacterium]|nr:carboxypeptidase regulatory-like domain-containing protein [Gemmatimonadales bacterium]
MSRSWLYWSSRGVALAALALFLGTGAVLAQTGSIEGTVRNAQTASPLSGTRVTVRGTQVSATTNPNGYYRLDGVPVGTHELQAIALGFNAVTVSNAVVTVGRALTVNIEMLPAVINLDAVVVTGVIGETQKAKLAFTVDQVNAEAMPVPQVDAISALQGKVAGAVIMKGGSQPGSAPTILLRGPTSINAT